MPAGMSTLTVNNVPRRRLRHAAESEMKSRCWHPRLEQATTMRSLGIQNTKQEPDPEDSAPR
eukprot:9734711-Alexandrium_andersonii.AAC.1